MSLVDSAVLSDGLKSGIGPVDEGDVKGRTRLVSERVRKERQEKKKRRFVLI